MNNPKSDAEISIIERQKCIKDWVDEYINRIGHNPDGWTSYGRYKHIYVPSLSLCYPNIFVSEERKKIFEILNVSVPKYLRDMCFNIGPDDIRSSDNQFLLISGIRKYWRRVCYICQQEECHNIDKWITIFVLRSCGHAICNECLEILIKFTLNVPYVNKIS